MKNKIIELLRKNRWLFNLVFWGSMVLVHLSILITAVVITPVLYIIKLPITFFRECQKTTSLMLWVAGK